MRVLLACEYSGIVRDAFIRSGHDAISCDLLPSESDFGPHTTGDVLPLLAQPWDMIIAHPPCTFLTLAGARWLYDERYPTRWHDMQSGIEFFLQIKNADCPRIAIENPQPMQRVMDQVGRYDQKIQPWQFGEPETKGVCLWLKGLPKLVPTKIMNERAAKVWRMPPGPNRQKERSRFFVGIAEAMAQQWGNV